MNTIILLISFFSFFLFLLILKYWIIFQKRRNIGKYIRKEGPNTHFQKAGTPIMGGLVFLLVSFPFLFFKSTLFLSLSIILFGFLGLIDDLKLLKDKDYGIRPLRKIILSFLISVILFYISPHDYKIYWGNHVILNSKLIYIFLFFIIFIGVPNAVNLTDGLDGLAGGVSLISLFFLLILSIIKFNDNLIILETSLLITSLLAFLWYNSHPADIFMGDVGAFSLGGGIVALSVINKVELLLIFLGGIFLIESISVFIQVLFYKWKRKRIFLMSPIHHHFELKGMKETKIVWRFYIAQMLLIIGGLVLWYSI